MTSILLSHALLPDGWAADVRLTFKGGVIAADMLCVARPRLAARYAAVLTRLPAA